MSSPDSELLKLPSHVSVQMVSTEAECEHLRSLIGKEMVGMDCEWRPQMSKFDPTRPALLQLSDDKAAYLVDLVALSNNSRLNQLLTELFTNPCTILIGFGFRSDLDMLAKHLPYMSFYRKI